MTTTPRPDAEREGLIAQIAPEDRASMFIDWCALHGFGIQGWPTGAHDQLISMQTVQITRAAHAESALAATLAREARLREALEPFAAFVANTDPVWDDRRRIATLNYDFDKLTVGIFREACAALATREPQVKS